MFFVDRSYWVVWDELDGVPEDEEIWENFHFPTRDLVRSADGGSVMTSYPEGPNLLMLVASPGWAVQSEDTRMWPVSSRDTVPTVTLHYQTDGQTAAAGFVALIVPVDGRDVPPDTSLDRLEPLEGGNVRLHVTVAGNSRVLTTRAFDAD